MSKYIALSGDLIFYKNIIDYQPSNIVHISICNKKHLLHIFFFQRDVYLSTLHLIKNFFSFRADMSRDKNR